MKLHQNYRAIDCPSCYSLKSKGLAVEYYWCRDYIFKIHTASKYISAFTTEILKTDTLKGLYNL